MHQAQSRLSLRSTSPLPQERTGTDGIVQVVEERMSDSRSWSGPFGSKLAPKMFVPFWSLSGGETPQTPVTVSDDHFEALVEKVQDLLQQYGEYI